MADTKVDERPPVSFELTEGSGFPATADIIRLKKREAPQASEGALKLVACDAPDIFTASGQCRMDFGATLSAGMTCCDCLTMNKTGLIKRIQRLK